MKEYDVIILGGGIMGASTAEQLTRRGKNILLLEQFEPGHSRGSSHGDGRIIRFAYPEPIYLEMAQLAYPAWAELEQRSGQRLIQITGGWDCGPAGCQQLAELETNFQSYHVPYERLTAAESNRRFPQFHLDEGSEAIYQPDGGVVFATPAVQAIWQLTQAAGATTITGERIEAIEANGETVQVRGTSGRSWQAARLVITAGGWANKLLADLDLALPLQPSQEQVAYFAPRDEVDHRVGAMPIFIDYHPDWDIHPPEMQSPTPFYGLPQIDIPGVKIGWHHTGPTIDPDQPRPQNEASLRGTQEFVRRRFPHLDPTPIEVVTCLYTNSPDYHFILDRHPSLPNVIIGSGFSGHGFKFGPVIGRLLAALALDEPPALPLDPFAISRFGRPEQLRVRTGA